MTVPNTPEPCPTCKGFCCANHNETFAPSLRYRHSGVKWHSCPDCDDGTYEICSEPEPFVPQRTYEQGVEEGERRAQEAFRADIERYGSQLEAAHDRGVAEERAAVVAWLERAGHMPSTVEVFRRGEHRREEE